MQLNCYFLSAGCAAGATYPAMRANFMRTRRTGVQQIVLAMKLTAVFLLTACLQVAAHSRAQTVTLKMTHAPLVEVFKAIQQQTGFNILIDAQLLENASPISLDVKEKPVKEVIQLCLENQPYHFTVGANSITIKPAPDKFNYPVFLQPPVTGIITDEDGKPLEGINVIIKGTGIGVRTDANGRFSIDAQPGVTLMVSSVEYETQQYKVNASQKVFAIKLAKKVTALNEVVVNKGYYSEKQILSTGNVGVVSGEDIRKQPVTDPLLAIQGRVAGLYIQQASGVPGAYSSVMIRGQNTLALANKPLTMNDPLYIVDGVPFSSQTLTTNYIGGGVFGRPATNSNATATAVRDGLSPFNNLNPSDIESIEVLKDADATAIFGSRGANGVILITTRKGKAGRTSINAAFNSGQGTMARKLKLLNTQEYLEMRREAFKNDGINPGQYDYDVNGVWDTTRYTDWQKVLFNKPSTFTNAQLSISGGSVSTQFSLAGGYSNSGTTIPGDYSDQKTSLSVHLDHSVNRLKIGFSGSFTNDFNNMPGTTSFSTAILLPPDAPALYHSDGSLNWQIVDEDASFNNPMAYTTSRSKAVTNNLIGSLSLSYQLAKDLDFRTSLGYNYTEMNQNILSPSVGYAPPYNTDPNNRANSFANAGNKVWIAEPQINYHLSVWKGELSSLIGATFQNGSSASYSFYGYGFSSDALIDNLQGASTISFNGSSNSRYRYNAVFGRLNYNLADKYIVNMTMRRDGSSKFGPGKQFGNFGAVGAAWILTKENWVANKFSWLSFGKIRSSYGLTGNDQISDYQFVSTYAPTGASYQNINGLDAQNIGNPYFQWERVKKLEIALELGFLKDRIFISSSAYRNRTNNQLISYILPSTAGFAGVVSNLPALVENKGFEALLRTNNVVNKNFSWTTSVNFSLQRNKLVSFPGLSTSVYNTLYRVGLPVSSRYLYHYTGVDPLTGVYSFATKTGAASPIYRADAQWAKPLGPRYFGGITNTIAYKNFQLDFLFQFVKATGYNYLLNFPRPGGATNQPRSVLNRWQNPGDQSGVQRYATGNVFNNSVNVYRRYINISDATVSDASFIRLKNVALSYRISESFARKLHLQASRIFIQCQNLLTITRYEGLDPESQGLSMPPLRMITAGINVTL